MNQNSPEHDAPIHLAEREAGTAGEPPTANRKRSRTLHLFGSALVVAAATGTVLLFTSRRTAEAHEVASRRAALAEGPRVALATVARSPEERVVQATGEAHAFQQAMLYAKVSGYLKTLKVDRGDVVKQGDLLAVLESPDAEQQVAAARADVAVKKAVAQRDRALARSKIVSEQQAQEAEAALEVARAQLARAQVLEGYAQLRAPFDGVITGRYADPGALLPAATGNTASAQPVLELSDVARLRVNVYLGQDDAAGVQVGDAASLTLPSGKKVEARVSRRSGALDPRTRTMRVEIDLDNRTLQLVPGTFLPVTLHLKAKAHPVVPAGALISRRDRLYVATVKDRIAHLVPVEAGASDGETVQILAGLTPGQQVAVNAGEELSDGMKVDPVTPKGGR